MVALIPSQAEIDQLLAARPKITSGEIEHDVHVTLLYLGKCDDIDLTKLSMVMSQAPKPIDNALVGRIGAGHGWFYGVGDDGTDAFFATVDIPGLADYRTRLVDYLAANGFQSASDHDFCPHSTVAYVEYSGDLRISTPVDVEFQAVTVCHGDTWKNFYWL